MIAEYDAMRKRKTHLHLYEKYQMFNDGGHFEEFSQCREVLKQLSLMFMLSSFPFRTLMYVLHREWFDD